MLKKILLFFFVLLNVAFSTTYYVDATKGNDSNTGSSENSAWQTISKVNSFNYEKGDQILFKCGGIWNEALFIRNKNHLSYGSYGSGNKPIITTRGSLPGWNEPANWDLRGGKIWRIKIGKGMNYMRMFFNGKEYKQDTTSNTLNSSDRWYRSGIYIYVFAPTNPANYYNNIEVPYTNLTAPNYTCRLGNSDYISIKGIDFQGGYGTILAQSCNYLVIEDCNIGAYCNGAGFYADGGSNHGILRNNTIDYFTTISQYHSNAQSAGIELANGASFWKIYDNIIKDWILAGFFIMAGTDSCNYNEFYKNEVSAPNQSYGRAFSLYDNDSHSIQARYNKIYRNYFHDYNVKAQLRSDHCEISYNIFANVTDNFNTLPIDHAYNNAGNCLFIYGDSHNNKVYNNTFFNTTRSAIYIDGADNNYFINNLFAYSGHNDGVYGGFGYVKDITNMTVKNNLVWYPERNSSHVMIRTTELPDNKYVDMTISEFNHDSRNKNKISGNIQHNGALNTLLKISSGTFSLPAGSPAINAGLNEVWMQSRDYNGNNIDGSRDIGAVEFIGNSDNIPVITSIPGTTALIGELYTYNLKAKGTPKPTYSLKKFPTGMNIDSLSGIIRWIPGSIGEYDVIVEASNKVGTPAQQSFNLSVEEAGSLQYLPGMIGYWKLDEISGNTFNDEIGKKTATAGAAPATSPTAITGRINGARRFDGQNTEINIDPDPLFNFEYNEDFSIEFWVKRPGTLPLAFNEVVIGRDNGLDGFRWCVGIDAADGYAYYYMLSKGTVRMIKETTQKITDGEWHHIVAIRKGSSQQMLLIVDGVSTAHTKNFSTGFSSSTAKINIGWWSTNKSYTLQGSVDEVALYNIAMPDSIIIQHYNNGLNGVGYRSSGLLKPINSSSVFNNFTASDQNNGSVLLKWQTALIPSLVYEVERKFINNSNWQKINLLINNGTNNYEFIDKNVPNNQLTYYRIKAKYQSGDHYYSETKGVSIIPLNFDISQNFPNPFNPITVIEFQIPFNDKISLEIFNIMGEKVKTLIDGELKEPGYYNVTWDGTNKKNESVSSGVYIYKISSDKYVKSKKMTLLK